MTPDMMSDASGCASLNEAVAPIPSLSLRDYVQEAGRAIRQTLPPEAWVDATVLKVKATQYGLSLELTEPNIESTANAARLRAFIGKSAVHSIQDQIGLSLDCELLTGVHARLRIAPKFDVSYHLSGNILGLDPALADSLLVKRIAAIRSQLTTERVFDLQRTFGPPDEITRIAVIHPYQSASWADLHGELGRLEKLGLLHVVSLPATFEGPKAPVSLVAALLQARHRVEHEDIDLVLVVRGGGASAGLGALTNVSIARAICQMPVPVITGLGHANDRSILDEVAWRSCDTPSKALQLVKSVMRRRAEAAFDSYLASVNHIDRLLEQFFRPRLVAKETELRHAFEITFAKHRDQLRDTWFSVQGHLLSLRSDLKHVASNLDREAQGLLTRAGALPQKVDREAGQLYAAIGQGAQTRYGVLAATRPSIQTSADLAESLLARQSHDLELLFAAIEIAARRRLANEGDRLGQKLQALDALGIEGTLSRGFVLPLDAERRIVRSADAARAIASFELLFCDGTVACHPVSIA